MVFEHIEDLKRMYTDKFVVVDASRPDLKRFEGITGTVKTVNMSGRALVQFDAYDNIGWYDIDVDYLKIIDKPLAKPETKEKAAPAKKAAAPKTDARKPAAKMSMEEMLAAARNKSPAAKTPAATPEAKPASAAPAAAKPATSKPGAMSTADILAAARAGKSATTESETKPAAKPAATTKPIAEEAAPEPEEAEPTTAATVVATTPASELPKTVDEIVAFCRQRDAK